MQQAHPFDFFGKLRWVDGRPLMDLIEPYRRDIFERAYEHDDGLDKAQPGTVSRVNYNLILCGRAKKNWKSADLALWCLYKLLMWLSWSGNQVYTLCNDEDQARDNLELGKKLIDMNSGLKARLTVKQNVIERKDRRGFWAILPAGDVVGTHGKTYLLCSFDEIHGYKNWDILEAMQLDPSRPDAQMWLTSYASIYHKPGVPLFDLSKLGREEKRPRMLFSWYSSTYTTDPDFAEVSPERRANPSSVADEEYLAQQRVTLPSHKFRRLHLNEPGLPEGSAFTFEAIDAAIERGIKVRPPQTGIEYVSFVDMSGGSSDDACLAIAHMDGDAENGKAILDCVVNQGQKPPFDPRKAITRFAKVLKTYRVVSVVGDAFAGQTFRMDFENEGISYNVSELSKSEIYESFEPRLNSGRVSLLDDPTMESQLLGLIWKGGKIDHPAGEHDDWANAAAGAIWQAFEGGADWGEVWSGGGGRMSVAREYRDADDVSDLVSFVHGPKISRPDDW